METPIIVRLTSCNSARSSHAGYSCCFRSAVYHIHADLGLSIGSPWLCREQSQVLTLRQWADSLSHSTISNWSDANISFRSEDNCARRYAQEWRGFHANNIYTAPDRRLFGIPQSGRTILGSR